MKSNSKLIPLRLKSERNLYCPTATSFCNDDLFPTASYAVIFIVCGPGLSGFSRGKRNIGERIGASRDEINISSMKSDTSESGNAAVMDADTSSIF